MKNIFITTVTFFLIQSAYSQDTLVKRNGEEMIIKVIEVFPKEVKFKLFDNPDGPTITMYRSEIHKIIYQNGTEQMFSPMKKVELGKYDTRREPGKAVILSVLLPGGGQYYNKQYGKGAIMTGVFLFGFTTTMIGSGQELGLLGTIGWFAWPASSLWSIIDAPIQSGIINRRYNLANIPFLKKNNMALRIDPMIFNQTSSTSNVNLVYGANLSLRFK